MILYRADSVTDRQTDRQTDRVTGRCHIMCTGRSSPEWSSPIFRVRGEA